jgi:hypothetical protein
MLRSSIMIELDDRLYPSEVRSSQPVELETQETPAGSDEFPGLSEQLAIGRKVVAGNIIETGEYSGDLDTLKGRAVSVRGDAANEGEAYDGLPANPAGDGHMTVKPETPTPHLEPDNLPWQLGERDAARALLAEMHEQWPDARVLRFIRYPDARRLMLIFTEGDDPESLQQQY